MKEWLIPQLPYYVDEEKKEIDFETSLNGLGRLSMKHMVSLKIPKLFERRIDKIKLENQKYYNTEYFYNLVDSPENQSIKEVHMIKYGELSVPRNGILAMRRLKVLWL